MAKVKISAVIITKNEESNITRCLDSLKGIADEIVVVDSFSTDGTVSLLSKYDIIFRQRGFTNYADQRNYASSLASGEYILTMDADEQLSEDLRNNILKIKDSLSENAYCFNRLYNCYGTWVKYGNTYHNRVDRLVKKELCVWHGEVHEVISLNAKPRLIKGDLYHYAYVDIHHHLSKLNRYTDIQSREMYAKGRRASFLKLIIAPCFEFFRAYFIKLGFLAGYNGFTQAIFSAHTKFIKYEKLRLLTKQNKRLNS